MRFCYLLLAFILVAAPAVPQEMETGDIDGLLDEIEERIAEGEPAESDRIALQRIAEDTTGRATVSQSQRAALLLFLTTSPEGEETRPLPDPVMENRSDRWMLVTAGATIVSLIVFNGVYVFGDEMGLSAATRDTIGYTSLGLSIGGTAASVGLLFRGVAQRDQASYAEPLTPEGQADYELLRQIREDTVRDLYHARETAKGLRIVSIAGYGTSAVAFAGLVASLLLGNEAWQRYNDAAFSPDATELRDEVDAYGRAAFAFGSIAVIGAGIGTMATLVRPNQEVILSRIEEVDRLLATEEADHSSK